MTAHGALGHILGSEVAQLSSTIADELDAHRRELTELPGFSDRGTINAGLLLHRLWLGHVRADVQTALREAQLRAVAAACSKVPGDLLDAVHARRAAAAAALAARHRGWIWRSILVKPLWRLVVGHGEDSVHESGLTLSPTYGVPVLPGTALKGLAVATSRHPERGLSDRDTTLFGSPRPQQPPPARRGSVVIWDALPTRSPRLVVDVLTPHVKGYYDEGEQPAEYHNPVPIRFLAVEDTQFRAYLIGPSDDVTRCVPLITSGLGELGVGGKTSAGYGYCEAHEEPT